MCIPRPAQRAFPVQHSLLCLLFLCLCRSKRNLFGSDAVPDEPPRQLATISTEFADIFRNNSLKNGLLPIIVDKATHAWLLANPGAEVTVDLEACEIRLPNGKNASFPIDGFARHCILDGVDQTGFLLKQADAITQFEKNRSWQP